MSAARIWIVAGEESGDQLGGALMRALRRLAPETAFAFAGVGGAAMAAGGVASLFPLEDVAVMGFLPVLARARTLLARIDATAAALVAARPDLLVIVDSPGFTHRVARRARARLSSLPVLDYVSPSVWAWRPGRAKRMRAYVDEVLALLPFEPAAHARLGGPSCTYVGHPLLGRLDDLRPDADDAAARLAQPPLVAVLPGSRRSEIDRLMPAFGAALAGLVARVGPVRAVLPAVPWHRARIAALAADWPVRPEIVADEAGKHRAFRRARVALAASGTVTLELALAGVPTVVAYRVSRVEEIVARRLIQVPTIVLPNLILGRNAVPEFIQAECTPERLATALAALLPPDAPARRAQVEALRELDGLMRLPDGADPAEAAARRVLARLSACPSRPSSRVGEGQG